MIGIWIRLEDLLQLFALVLQSLVKNYEYKSFTPILFPTRSLQIKKRCSA